MRTFVPTVIQDLLQRQAIEQAANGCADIADALTRSEDGTLSVSFAFKLTKTGNAVHSVSKWAFSERKSGEDSEDSEAIEDPNQPKLPMEDNR
jgi:hypothetical protein